jgi:hypothetical protein
MKCGPSGDRSFGFGECQSGPDPDIANFMQEHAKTQSIPELEKLLLAHLRSEGI